MFKIAGALGVFLPCLVWGILKSYKLKKRCESLSVLKQATERLGVEISFTKKRLERIFTEISRDFSLPVFYNTAILIRKAGLKTAWSESLDRYADEMALSETDIKTLSGLGDISGYAGDEQQRLLHTLTKLLELSCNEAGESYKRCGKLSRSIGLLVGLLLVILLF